MKLDYACVRDIMLCIEEETTPNNLMFFLDVVQLEKTRFMYENTVPQMPNFQKKLAKKYSNEILLYHVNYCIKAELLESGKRESCFIPIYDLTPLGHEFLSNIREKSNFIKITNTAKTAGIESLKSFITIAEHVAADIITNALQR